MVNLPAQSDSIVVVLMQRRLELDYPGPSSRFRLRLLSAVLAIVPRCGVLDRRTSPHCALYAETDHYTALETFGRVLALLSHSNLNPPFLLFLPQCSDRRGNRDACHGHDTIDERRTPPVSIEYWALEYALSSAPNCALGRDGQTRMRVPAHREGLLALVEVFEAEFVLVPMARVRRAETDNLNKYTTLATFNSSASAPLDVMPREKMKEDCFGPRIPDAESPPSTPCPRRVVSIPLRAAGPSYLRRAAPVSTPLACGAADGQMVSRTGHGPRQISAIFADLYELRGVATDVHLYCRSHLLHTK
ncbi:hypothetical protein MSAN_01891500 [Mycena sanguinolenta]|uniref:Uncharacterized protein n=1 Tax=Mycena sanguinolenta TaxID=230812 RepID=A0A8H6XNR4_9AGAR|nr:hypothetical protein MSAN_01891500 [Mycena sanguinolenta]